MISINMAMSMDGKIATKARGPVKLGSDYDSRRMAEIRAEHQVVINGASTFLAYPKPLTVEGEDLLFQRRAKGWPDQPISAVVSSQLKIPRGTPWERAKGAERWIFCGKDASVKVQKSLEVLGVKVIRGRAARPQPTEIVKALAKAGVERVLLEGGGEFNASFLEQGLVDQIFLTVVPILVGGSESPTWCEGKGFLKGKFPRFQLVECRNVQGELYLHYRR
jgi:5-amino-6-(5-phosphoribosylamino)uracil reductase